MVATPVNIYTQNLPWHIPPLSLLTITQQLEMRDSAQISRHLRGEILWSSYNPGGHLLILAGEVRLIQEPGKSVLEPGQKVLLHPGDWFGDVLELTGEWQARVASKEVVVVLWYSKDWYANMIPELRTCWEEMRWRYQPFDPNLAHPATGYPYLFHLDTAAACLSMVTEQVEATVPIKSVRQHLKGQTPAEMVAAAEKLGMRLQHVETEWAHLAQLTLPALLHWQRQHWVVVYEVKRDRLIIADPTNSRQTCESVPRSQIEEIWDGQLWLVEPISKLETEPFNLKWFIPAVWRYRTLFFEVLIASLILQLLGLGTPMLSQQIIDKAIVHDSLSTLYVMALAILCIAVFEAGLGMLRIFTFHHTVRRLNINLTAQLFRHLLRLPLPYFESRRVGDVNARVQELENIRQFLTGTVLTVVIDGIFVVVYLAVMVYYSPKLTLASLAVVPFLLLSTWVVTPMLRDWTNEAFNRRADGNSFLIEALSGIHAVKAHTAELPTRERWEGLFARYINKDFRATTLGNVNGHLGKFLTDISELLILFFGVQLVIGGNGEFTIGKLVAFQMLSGRAISPLLNLASVWQQFQQVLLSVDRIGDVLNADPEAEIGFVLPPLQGGISFENVVFRYKPDLEPALNHVSFTIEPGMFVGIVGRSGSGKSTLSKLLQQLYLPESGRILVDGTDVKGADLQSLREQVGIVLQDDFLFDGSILDNLSFSDPDITLQQAKTAAMFAAADEFIDELPQGYHNHIGERGTGLSGGQRQRLALARLFLSDAPILVLDEATSALDSETEQRVLQNLKEAAHRRTVLMIAHRFAPLKSADLILVLDKGVLVEQGRHEDLLERKGVYWALYQRQQASV